MGRVTDDVRGGREARMPKATLQKPPIVSAKNLRPYKSLLLGTLTQVLKPEDATAAILGELQQCALASKRSESVSAYVGPSDGSLVVTSFFTYVEHRPAAWATSPEPVDVINHLVVLCQGKGKAKRHVALFFSDKVLRDKAAGKIVDAEGDLATIELIPAGTMNAAYVKGKALTLWLSGTHRRVASKVDNKIISGMDLQHALEPLGDQTYFFTAARARLASNVLEQAVGSSPRRSRLWIGPSHDWSDFTDTVAIVFELLVGATRPVESPLPVLAAPLSAADLSSVEDAYDVALIPPELLDPTTASEENLEARERLSAVAFAVVERGGPSFRVEVEHPVGRAIGSLRLEFSAGPGGSVVRNVADVTDLGVATELLGEVQAALDSHRGWLKVWYESGHTLADEAFYRIRFRDQPFHKFVWDPFTGYDVTKEKPDQVTAQSIGNDDSLFSWVKNCWAPPDSTKGPGKGWLACDDGSMEKADFLHLDTVGRTPTLSLIHVKGAKSDAAKRKISVADYEIVTGQAVKNLRWADRSTLGEALAGALKDRIGDKVWHNGKAAARKGFVDAIARLSANHVRAVVIVQPRARKAAVESARKNRRSTDYLRLAQLETLLLGARANCLSLNADLWVVGHDA